MGEMVTVRLLACCQLICLFVRLADLCNFNEIKTLSVSLMHLLDELDLAVADYLHHQSSNQN